MTGPPWGHKPPPVEDRYRYWAQPPPELSPRVQYWLRRYADGSWHPNRSFRVQDYDGQSAWLGVYIWEWMNVIAPVLLADRESP